jgi:hypothetical protein
MTLGVPLKAQTHLVRRISIISQVDAMIDEVEYKRERMGGGVSWKRGSGFIPTAKFVNHVPSYGMHCDVSLDSTSVTFLRCSPSLIPKFQMDSTVSLEEESIRKMLRNRGWGGQSFSMFYEPRHLCFS